MPFRRFRLLLTATTCACLAGGATAEVIPGRNVNMVSGTDWPGGDPFLQRQNEGSIAASTRNPLHLLAGGNDYRSVDIPGVPGGAMSGDAWLGYFYSRDGGQRWKSTLLPGYPQDASPEGLASPIHGLQAGADPVVRAGANGMMFFTGIAFDRDAITQNASGGAGHTGKLFLARFIDDNARETGNPFRYLGSGVIDNGNEGRFLDKPWQWVDVPRPGGGTCVIPGTPGPDGIAAQSFPAGNVYVSYTIFVSNNPNFVRTKLMFARSGDCGLTWKTTKLSEGYRVNQGSVIAVHPATGAVYVAWRRFKTDKDPDAVLIAKSTDGGRTFTKGIEVATFGTHTLPTGGVVSELFEQGTSIVSFRTTAFPALAVTDTGVVYAAWSQRNQGPLDAHPQAARVMLRRSTDGISWTEPPFPADDTPAPGHEFMPSLMFHAGRLSLIYYSLREDHTIGVMRPDPGDPAAPLTEEREAAGDLAAPAEPGKVFEDFVRDVAPPGYSPLQRRHTLDLRVAEAAPAPPGAPGGFTSTRVSQYVFGDEPDSDRIRQLQFNPGGLPIFACQGALENCRAFIGDYVDLAGAPAIVPDGFGRWKYNTAPSAARVVHTIATDNRDVRPPPPGKTWADYTPPFSPFSQGLGPASLFDPAQPRPACTEQGAGFTTAGMRNQNLYTSRLTQGLVASSPQNAKPLGYTTIDGQTLLLQRAFVVLVQNTTAALKTFRLTIANQPADGGTGTGKASFLQFASPPLPDPLTELFVRVPPKSTATRTVFVTSAVADASVSVLVEEFSGLPADGGVPVPPSAGGLQDTVVLNPDITNPDITNPDITNPDITNPDITNAEVYNPDITNPDITNPDITNPDITNPDITNPDITNPDITNVQVYNPDITNPDITNPDITNPDIANPDITNPDITNPDITNGSVAEATWTVRDHGNTSGGYKVKLLVSEEVPDDFKTQLVIHRGHSTPVAVGCELAVQRQPILVANVPNPVFTTLADADLAEADVVNPDITNATLYVGPGDDWAQVTLRIVDVDPAHGPTPEEFLTTRVTPVVVAHAVNTVEAARGSRTPPIAVPDTTIVFTTPAALATAGRPIRPVVALQARDKSGAVVPGAPVTLALGSNPSGATLGGNTATTDTLGMALFPDLTIDKAGTPFTLAAFVGDLPPATSPPFRVVEACAADGAPSVTSYGVEGPGLDSFPLASREAADFDGDGDRDLAVIHGDGTITKMAGNGLGAFARALPLRIASTKTPRALALGDFNEDGLTDVIVAYTDSSQLGVVLSDRNAPGRFFTADATVIALAGGPSAVAAGDVDGDGHLDLVATLETADSIAVLLGDGEGGFAAPATFPAGNAPLALALGRFDADGALDLAVVHYPDDNVFLTGSVSVLVGDGRGGFSVASTTSVGLDPAAIAAGDLDTDGRLDLAVANRGGNDVTVLFGDGDGGFRKSLAVAAGATPSSVAIGDFNADKRLDLATAHGAANAFSLVFGDGAGGFGLPSGFAAGVEPVDVSAGDFNRDGRTDLVVTNRLHDGDCCDSVSVVIGACGATTADLTLQLADAPDPVAPGAALTYTMGVANKGPFAATGVVLTQQVQAAVQAASPSAGRCTLGPPVVCDLGRLEPGGASTVTVVVTVPGGAPSLVSTATVRASELDRFPAGNTATATTAVDTGPRTLFVTTTADGDPGSLRQALQDSNANTARRTSGP